MSVDLLVENVNAALGSVRSDMDNMSRRIRKLEAVDLVPAGGGAPVPHALPTAAGFHSGALPVTDLDGWVQGRIMRGGAVDWEVYDASTANFILQGDGLDVVSVAFDWDNMSAGAGADMVHDHSAPGEGGVLPVGSITAHPLLGAQHTATVAQAPTRGSLVYGNAAGNWDELVIGATSTHLESDGTDVAWQINLTMADDAWIGAAANDVRVEFDNSSGFLKLGLGDAAGADRVQVLDSGNNVVTYIDSDGDADFEGHVAIGATPAVSATSTLLIDEQYTANAGTVAGTTANIDFAPTGNHTTEAYAMLFTATLTTAQTRTGGGLWGLFGRSIIANGVDARDQNLIGGFFSTDVEDAGSGGGTGAIVAASLDATTPFVDTGNALLGYGLRITQGVVGAGSIGTLHGINIADINAGTASFAILTNAGNVVLNDGGNVDTDFRVESLNSTHTLFVDGGLDRVGVNEAAPDANLHVSAATAMDIGLIVQTTDDNAANNIFETHDSGGNTLSGADERGILFSDGGSDPTNFFAGPDAGNVAATGTGNFGMGLNALDAITIGINNFGLGTNAGGQLTEGRSNIAIGDEALASAVISNSSIAIGILALEDDIAGGNIGIGEAAGRSITTGQQDICIGLQAAPLMTTGIANTIVGGSTYSVGNGDRNSIFGNRSMQNATSAGNSVSVGYQAGWGITSGQRHVSVGYNAGFNQTTGDDCVYIGYDVRGVAAESDKLYIHNSFTPTPLILGDFTAGLTFHSQAAPAVALAIQGFAMQADHLLVLQTSIPDPFFESSTGLTGSTTTWNQQGVDIDYVIEAVGVADAFFLRGSDGQITLGVLGAGFVQSTVGGVLSSAAIGAGDLPAHTHSGAGQGGSLAVGTTDTDLTAGSVFFAGVAGVIQQDNANFFWDDGNDRLGIGTNAPANALHVQVSPNPQVLIERTIDFDVTIGIKSPSTDWAVGWDFSEGNFVIAENIDLTASQRFVIEATSGNVGISTNGPDRKLDVLDAAAPQLRLTHTDGVTYVDFQANANGYLFIDPTGDRTGFRTNTPSYVVHVPWQAGDAVTTMLVGDGAAAGNNQIAIRGDSFSNVGMRGTSETDIAVQGISVSGRAGVFQSTSDDAVDAFTTTGIGLKVNLLGAGAAIAQFLDNGNVTVQMNDGGSSPLEVTQLEAAGAVAVLELDQNDIDEPFIHFDGTSVNGAITGNLVDDGDQSGVTLEGWVKMQITDSAGNIANGDYWIPFYSLIA